MKQGEFAWTKIMVKNGDKVNSTNCCKCNLVESKKPNETEKRKKRDRGN